MKVIVFVAVVLCVAAPLSAVYNEIPDYFWKPYFGVAPKSALKVSKECDPPIYIGQGWFKEGLLPGGLYGTSPNLEVSATGKRLTTNKNNFILCTRHADLYKWVATTTKGFADLKKKCELVTGGVETDNTMYIGRKTVDGKITVGKIYKYGESRELVIPLKNAQEKRYTDFEVLTYNCKKC